MNISTMSESKKHIKLAVVIPVGPDNDGRDTIESIFLYATSNVHIFAIDDSKNKDTRDFLSSYDKRITVLQPSGRGIRGGLWTSLARTYEYILERYDFDVLLRIDTDALLIDFHPEDDAIKYFSSNPKVGMLGSYKEDCNGDKRDFKVVKSGMRKEYGFRGLRDIQRRKTLRRWIRAARKNGYSMGEHILGAADFQSPSCLMAMQQNDYLKSDVFGKSVISEDHLFSLLTKACGYELADFSTGDLPMGLRWKGLPDSPANLVARQKKIIHSIKFWEDTSQDEIRDFYRQKREVDSRK